MKLSPLKISVVFLLILSGICGLIYEVAWSKYLALFIGNTAYSHMIVLATYMGGLALGAFYWGKFADKVSNQLRLYGLLEAAIGVFCFAYPYIIEFVGRIFISIASSIGGSSSQLGFLALKFLLSIITLILPTFFMGGTLPILTKLLSKNITDTGKDVATLYYINSLGAVIGSGLAGFFLIRQFGLDGVVWLAASLNILIGLSAVLVSRSINGNAQLKPATAKLEDTQQQSFSKKAIRIAVITAAASGFIAMLYELSWIRLLSNILGSTTHSFTVMLIAFISGIALGSLIVSFVIKKIRNLVLFLAICQYGTAVSMILTLPLYERFPYFLLKISALLSNRPENFSTFLSLEFLFCFIIMLVPTTFSGMSLPVASRIATSDMRFLGKSIGGVFSINTIGSVVGALCTGLMLIPILGVKSTLESGVLLNGLLGLIIVFNARVSSRVRMGFALFFVLIAVGYRIQFPVWNENFLISGVFRTLFADNAKSYGEFKNKQNEGQKIVWFKEGVNANVAIRESRYGDTIQKSLVINGKADASTVGDLQTQVLLGQIPLMLCPDSGDALVIGLGSGITCGSALRHPLRSLDCVEIASEVVECNSYFTRENYNFMTDPRVKIHIEDALTHLKTSSKKYNYIISEPSNPWIAGIGNLYSLEYFNLCKDRLLPGGVVTQWFHTYDVNNQIVRLVLCTISKAFPFVTIWKVSDADIIIVASADPLSVDFDAMEKKIKDPRIAQDLARIKMYDVPALLSTQTMSARNNAFLYVKNDLNTAKRPLLEFLASRAHFTHESVTVLDSLDERFSFKDKNLWFSDYERERQLSFENYMNIARYRNAPQIGDLGLAYTALKKCLKMDPGNQEARLMAARVSRDLGLQDMAIRDARREELRVFAESYPDDVSAAFGYVTELVDYYRIENSIVNPQQMEDAVELLKRCVQLTQGRDERFHFILATILTGAGRYSEAAEAFKSLLQFQKAEGTGSTILSEKELIYRIGESYYNAGNLALAEKYFKRSRSLDPDNSNSLIMLNKIPLKNNGLR